MLFMEKLIIRAEYVYFIDIFWKKLAKILLKLSAINNYAIDLEKNKKLFYAFIPKKKLVELKVKKTYININFANSLIRSLKSFINVLAFFIWKFHNSFYIMT